MIGCAERGERGRDLAELAVAQVDDQRDRLEQERDRERRHEHHRRRLPAQRPEDDEVHRQRERDHDGEAGDDAPRDRPARGEGERVGAGHDQLAVGEVDEPQDAEDEADADGHQRVDRPEPDRVGERLEAEGRERSRGEVGGDDLVGVVRVRRGQRRDAARRRRARASGRRARPCAGRAARRAGS